MSRRFIVISGSFFGLLLVRCPAVRSLKKFQGEAQADGQKGRGGEGIFARLFCPPKADWGGRKRFRRLALSQTSKQNNFQFLLKEKWSRAKYKKIERKLFCFVRQVLAGGNAGAGLKVKIRIFVKKSSDFNQKVPPKLKIGIGSRNGVAPQARHKRIPAKNSRI